MSAPSNITQFQPAADRSNEACRLITTAILHELPETDELYVGVGEQLYAIVLPDGRTSIGRVPDLDAEHRGFSVEALAADADNGTIAFATAVDRTEVAGTVAGGGPAAGVAAAARADTVAGTAATAAGAGSKEIVTWAISSYVPEQFATATLLTVLYWRNTPLAPVAQTTQYWAAEQLPFDEATAAVVAWVDAEKDAAQKKAAELAGMLVPGGVA